MNTRLQAHAERRRTRRLHTHRSRPPVELPASFLATIWPHTQPPRCSPRRVPAVRHTWATARTVVALCWPARLDRPQHPILWRLARITWTIAGLTIYTAAIAIGLAALLTRPAAWVVANLGGYALVMAGWSPPLTDADLNRLADPERALFDDDHEHHRHHYLQPPASTPVVHPTAMDYRHTDPDEGEQARARAAAARHERQTAALEALAHQPPTPPPPTAPQPAMARRRQLVSFRRWVLRAVIVLSLLSATGLLITAWTLAALSAAGTIAEPPTNDQLIDGIHARTEARTNDITDQFHANTDGDLGP